MSEKHGDRKIVTLLVDDDELVRSLVHATLAAAGYQVLTAGNGQEALRLSRAHPGPIHLLLTDVHMPAIDGLSLARIISEERPSIRILLMTGHASLYIPPGMALGLIPKPFNMADLLARIKSELQFLTLPR